MERAVKTAMKKAMKRINKAAAAALAAIILLTSLCPAAVIADGNTVTVSNAEDFFNLVKNCKSDTWSRGKTVVLTDNIDLSDKTFSPIPTFGGVFDGNGYTISSVNISSKGSYLGLFRYIQKGATVKNLNVSGNIAPQGTKQHIGGICGENSGTITNCSFTGSISGGDEIGGICGTLTESGRVESSRSDADVTGNSFTGGIAGRSEGVIYNCENTGGVNKVNTETEKSIQDLDLDLTNIRTTENIDASTDTGGICGYSKGRIINCVNRGDVGYKSVGYNTGGICGRQAGYVSGCENYGTVNGRKDIGGIAGQAEPYVLLEYTKDMLEKINDVFSRIQDIIDGGSVFDGDDLSDSFDRIDTKVGNASDSAELLSDDLKKYADDAADEVNKFSDKLHDAIDDMSGVLDTMSSATDKLADGTDSIKKSGDYMKKVVDALKRASEEADDINDNLHNATARLEQASAKISSALGILEEAVGDIEDGMKKLQDAIGALSEALKKKNDIKNSFKEIWSSLDEIRNGFGNAGSSIEDIVKELEELKNSGYIKGNITETIENLKALAKRYKEIANAISSIGDAFLVISENFDIYAIRAALRILSRGFDDLSDAFYSLRRAVDALDRAVDELTGVSDDVKSAVDELQNGLDSISGGARDLSGAMKELSGITDRLSSGDSFKMPVASEIFGSDFDDFFDHMRGVRDEFSSLRDILKDKKNKLSDELDDLSDEIDSLTSIMTDTYNDKIKADEDGFVEDISDTDTVGDTRGKIELSVNNGKVYGDLNVGGIVGSMAVEYDFDPEDDVKKNGEKSLNFTYRTKCVVRRCKNNESVATKKNYGGGIVGRMDLGSVISCENYGDISADDGDYIGGIAGKAESAVRNSASKCSLSGKNYVGGIVGEGSSVMGCYALAEVLGHEEYAGSIAGKADRSGFVGNKFVSDTLGGIDDISYGGEAEQTDIGGFVGFVKSGFGTDVDFKLVFVADDKEVGTVSFQYKEAIGEEKIPKVPEKAGYYGKWSYYNFDEATYDATITAEYYRDIDLIESELCRENGKPVLLVCGAFDDGASVKAAERKSKDEALHGTKVYDAYSVEIEGTYAAKHTVRYLPLSDKNVDIYIEHDGKVERVDTKKFGSYIEFDTSAGKFNLYEAKRSYAGIVVMIIAILLLCGTGALLIHRVKVKIKKKIGGAEESTGADNESEDKTEGEE